MNGLGQRQLTVSRASPWRVVGVIPQLKRHCRTTSPQAGRSIITRWPSGTGGRRSGRPELPVAALLAPTRHLVSRMSFPSVQDANHAAGSGCEGEAVVSGQQLAAQYLARAMYVAS